MQKVKINNIFFHLFLFHIFFTQIFSSYVILPFNEKKFNSSSFISKTNHFTLLSIGQPKKTIEMYLKLWQYNFYIRKGLCRPNSFSDYSPYESETFKKYSEFGKNIIITTENFFLYANDLYLKKNITIKDMKIYYTEPENIDDEKICGIIGFNSDYINSKYNDEHYFINTLKQKNITSY